MSQYSEEIERRRTFAIISHPDAGMKGDGFRAFVKPGDRVRAGEELIAFDREKIAGAGHSDMVIMVLTNPGNSGAISWQTGRRVRALADAVARID